jgi:hypothetical protein
MEFLTGTGGPWVGNDPMLAPAGFEAAARQWRPVQIAA